MLKGKEIGTQGTDTKGEKERKEKKDKILMPMKQGYACEKEKDKEVIMCAREERCNSVRRRKCR